LDSSDAPSRINSRLPLILLPHGHSQNGKAAYREIATFFSSNGYATLTFDSYGSGERQIVRRDGTPFAFTSAQHNILGTKMLLDGFNLRWFLLYDTMGALSGALTFDFIDGSRVGITGASGGGFNSFHSAAIDERIKVVVPAASVHSFKNRLYPDDCEQTVFDMIRAGLDYPDIASFLIAPRPLFIVANSRDIWDINGTKYVYDEAARFYAMHNAKDNLSIKIWDREHSYEGDQISAALEWFNKHLMNDVRRVTWDEMDRRNVPEEKECYVTEKGNLSLHGYKTPGRIFLDFAERKRSKPSPAQKRKTVQQLAAPVKKAAGYQTRYEIIDRYEIGGLSGIRIAFAPAKKQILPAEILVPVSNKHGVIILLDEISRLDTIEWQISLAAKGYVAVRPDLPGFGETAPEEQWEDWENWSQGFYSGRRVKLLMMAHLVGKDLAIERACAVSALCSVIRAMGFSGPVCVWGERAGAIAGLIAGIGDKRIKEIVMEKFLYSFSDFASREIPVVCSDNIIYGALRKGIDIPDMCHAFGIKKIKFLDPIDGLSMSVPYNRFKKIYR